MTQARHRFGRLRAAVRGSWYWQQLRENVWLLVASLLLAAFFTAVSYPGIFFTDTYDRITQSYALDAALQQLLSGQRGAPIRMWLSCIPVFFIAAARFAGNIALSTFFQAAFFFLVSFLLIKKLAAPLRRLQYLLFAACPLFFGVAVWSETSIGCAVGIAALLLMLTRQEKGTPFDSALELIFIVLAALVTFGYRSNAFTILPVLLFWICRRQAARLWKVLTSFALLGGLGLTALLPWMVNVSWSGNMCVGFIWETLLVIRDMDADTQADYLTYLDDIGGAGATQAALESMEQDAHVNQFLWETDGLNMRALMREGTTAKTMRRYLQLWAQQPQRCLAVKWRLACQTLGISGRLSFWEYYYDRSGTMVDFGFNDCWQRQLLVDTVNTCYIKTFSWLTLYPWLTFTLSGALVAVSWLGRDKRRAFHLLMLTTAAFYYAAFLINTQSFEVRYFFPSLYLLLIMDMAILFGRLPALRRWQRTAAARCRVRRRKGTA